MAQHRLPSASSLSSLLLLLLLLPACISAGCFPYEGATCRGIITYPVFAPSSIAVLAVESVLAGQMELLTRLGPLVDPVCYEAAMHYFCSNFFLKCQEDSNNVTSGIAPCQNVCERASFECLDVFRAVGLQDFLPVCTGLSNQNCVSQNATSSDELLADFSCPSPLILNPISETSPPTCVGFCCVPCPYGDYFYPEGLVSALDTLKIVVSMISFFSSVFVLVSYLLMPEKRSFPSSIITCLSISLIIFYLASVINLRSTKEVRCEDDINMAAPNDNDNSLCMAQSFFVLYGVLSAVLWYFLLVVNVYLNVVFLSSKIGRFHFLFYPTLFLLPLASVITAFSTKKTGYIFGFWCIAENGDFLNGVLFIPLACFLFPSVLLNLHVLLKIFWVAKRRHASLQNILHLQIRLFSFVMVVLFIFLFYWIHYQLKIKDLVFDPSAPWVRDWFICILEGGGQNGCTSKAKGFVPELAQLTIADLLACSLGIVLISFFGLRGEVYDFWREIIFRGNFRRVREIEGTKNFTRSGSSQNSRQSKAVKEEPQLSQVGQEVQEMGPV